MRSLYGGAIIHGRNLIASTDERSPLSDLIRRQSPISAIGVGHCRRRLASMITGLPPGLDWKICDRARLAPDSAFDGVFFTGVRTTRIYCRPVCPVRPARSANVVFFGSAAAAERAGFRPCLRCRPETAPGSPAWSGTATTVARAVRLIEAGFLNEASVAELADRLGMGSRHLLRLFVRHTGATPTEVAATRRVQKAKRLLNETQMPMSEIAFAAGFRSVRRFNDAFLATYGRSPSSFRAI